MLITIGTQIFKNFYSRLQLLKTHLTLTKLDLNWCIAQISWHTHRAWIIAFFNTSILIFKEKPNTLCTRIPQIVQFRKVCISYLYSMNLQAGFCRDQFRFGQVWQSWSQMSFQNLGPWVKVFENCTIFHVFHIV